LKLQNMVVPVALITWLTIVVAALSYSPAQDEEEFGEIKGVEDYLPEEFLDVRVRVDESTDLDTLNLKPADNK